MTEEIRYIANLQRQEEFDNEVTELKDELKRLEQENKDLKDNNNHLQAIIDDGRAENKRFREENKELKKQLSSTKCHLCGEGFLTPEGAELYDKKEQYRSALEEIREIAMGIMDDDIDEGSAYYDADLIINKINEVLEDETVS